MASDDHIKAHKASIRNREQLLASESCGCFNCLKTFTSSAITQWVDDGQTALCPACGIDSVIGTRSGYPVQHAFLRTMNAHWFAEDEDEDEDEESSL